MARKPRRGASSQSNTSGGTLFGIGFFCGLLVAVVLWAVVSGSNSSSQSQTTAAAKTSSKSSDAGEETTGSTTRFDFFTLLPEREVIVPDEETRPEVSANTKPVSYSLQAGSFRRIEDADRRRARIILLGLDARVETVRNSDNNTWHRVLVGPLTSRSAMAKARGTLISENIETLLLKNKG